MNEGIRIVNTSKPLRCSYCHGDLEAPPYHQCGCGSKKPEDALYELIDEMGIEDAWEDIDCCFDFDSNAWWSLEAVKKFLELYSEEQHHDETIPPVH